MPTTIQKVAELLRDAQQLASVQAPNIGGGGTVAAARGGFIWGPGTETSDSILARLSRGEFVINAKAVSHFGRSFFAALNAMQMPGFSLGGIVDGMQQSLSSWMIPGYATGGLVDFASAGGAARGLHPVALSINGGQVVNVHASPDAVEQMRRESAKAQRRSAGARPSWVR